MLDKNDALDQLKSELADKKEDLFLCQQDLEKMRNENIALKNFIQNVYESCEGMEDTELTLSEVLKNLKDNIRRFSKDHQIYL